MREIFRTLLIVAALVAAVPRLAAAEPTFRDGLQAYDLRDYARAQAIWTRLAGANDAKAQAGLGYMYYAGQGVVRDSRRAAQLFYPAANQGETTAQFFLALMHRTADGVAASPELSLMWCELAMSGGQPAAFEWHERIMADLTETQRREAWRLVVEWYRIRDKSARR